MRHGYLLSLTLMTIALSSAALAQTSGALPTPHEACHGDVERICPTYPAGTEGAMKCIKENYDKMSDGCKDALTRAKAAGAMPQPAMPTPK
jgi:hypothetical protein